MSKIFRIDRVSYEICNIVDPLFKYEVVRYNEKNKCWDSLFKCNTHAEGRIKAHQLVNTEREIQNNHSAIKDYVNKINNKKEYCTLCHRELELIDKINGFKECDKCISKIYKEIE